ncbi:hypothetical protein LR48_Vigan01g110800 [Vigna angularis]|uniref:Uncharacterized protein n=1 Tax=Phaseolus angularis TaxID=3914 RepID=A0A0L9TLU2_PHAAN|nr:hypothetical protein LR48_Vigan01g110800 [Vigna angularis]
MKRECEQLGSSAGTSSCGYSSDKSNIWDEEGGMDELLAVDLKAIPGKAIYDRGVSTTPNAKRRKSTKSTRAFLVVDSQKNGILHVHSLMTLSSFVKHSEEVFILCEDSEEVFIACGLQGK